MRKFEHDGGMWIGMVGKRYLHGTKIGDIYEKAYIPRNSSHRLRIIAGQRRFR
jgi:hypothetical protein